MRISVSAKILTMPSSCVCCGNPASRYIRAASTRVEGKRVIRTKTSAWEFPQCSACGRHDDEWPNVSDGLLVFLVLLTCGIYLYFYLQRRRRSLSLCSAACARPRQAVQYLGWHGTVHHFDLHSPVFIREFLIANKGKLVDLDPRAQALLAAPPPQPARFEPPPVRPVAPSPVPRVARVTAPAATAPAPRTPVASAPAFAPQPAGAPTAPRPPQTRRGMQFLGLRDRVSVAGRTLLGPLTYVTSSPDVESSSAILTTAPVGRSDLAEPLPYWPSYAGASPHQRAVYLDWLASGRLDRVVPIGYVFIYFYGLEERILVDQCDHADVRAEVKRLLALYGENRSFRNYAENLLSFLVLSRVAELREEELREHLGPLAASNPSALAGVLAWFHLRDRPLPAEYAAIAVRTMENAKRGVVVQRAAHELAALFAIRYGEKFGDGLSLQAAKRGETVSYHPASGSLLVSRRNLAASIPHVLGRTTQFNPLVTLWNGCIADLKKVSSAKRNGASKALTAEAWAALPPELREEYDHPAQDAWDDLIARAPRLDRYHIVTAGQLVALGGAPAAISVSAVQLRQACETAALLGYAVEPDARVETKKRASGSELLIWRVEDTRPMDEALWRSAHTMLSLMISVASSDGSVASDEAAIVASFIEELFVVDDLMRSRVEALRHLLTRGPAKVSGIARTLQTTRTADELRKIGRVLVAVAGADGVISEAEHKTLRALYKGLGLGASDLTAAIVASGAQLASDLPVSVRPAEAGTPGEQIPAPPAAAKKVSLDGSAIAAILAETREVAALLSSVLDSEDDDAAAVAVPAPSPKAAPQVVAAPVEGVLATLDIRYQPIVQQLLTKPVWTTVEVRALAAGSKLMPGAIIETVNSWSDDQLGDYLIEEADGWHIKADLMTRASA